WPVLRRGVSPARLGGRPCFVSALSPMPAAWPHPNRRLSRSSGVALGQSSRQVGVKEAVEEMFAGFAADGKTTGDVGAGSQPALHGIANGHVLVLHDFTDFYAGGIFLPRLLADVGEVVIEDHGAFVHGEGKDEVRVHDAFVGIDHEIRVDPKVESAALARG